MYSLVGTGRAIAIAIAIVHGSNHLLLEISSSSQPDRTERNNLYFTTLDSLIQDVLE